MGQKVHPYGVRIGFNKTWKSRWYADKDYASLQWPNFVNGEQWAGKDGLCPIIYQSAYRPTLLLPPQLRSLDPAWSTCLLDLAGTWDPPIAHTSSTPSRAHAAMIVGSGRPPWACCGGLDRAIEPTPATWAGTTFITTLDTSGASPPGT